MQNSIYIYLWIIGIGDRPVGAGVAAAPPDKENNLSTRNQKLMKKQFHTRNSVHYD